MRPARAAGACTESIDARVRLRSPWDTGIRHGQGMLGWRRDKTNELAGPGANGAPGRLAAG